MRLFSSPRWTRCLQVSRMVLVVSVMLASFQLLAQAQGLTFYHKFNRQGMVELKGKPQSSKGKRPEKERKP